MRAKALKRAFTITELVLVVSGIGVLTTFVLPVTRQLEQRQRLTSCLGNLGRIGAASLAYSAEDARHLIMPMHAADVTRLHSRGWVGNWGWRTAMPHVFGGQTPTAPFPYEGSEVTVMLDEHWGGAANPWGAPTRPLNSYVESGGGTLQAFHCPADAGFPAADAAWDSPDIPPEAAGIPCFEMLGNSYGSNRCGVVWLAGSVLISGSLNVSPFGHAPEYILDPQRTVLYSDPLFYSLVRQLTGGPCSTPPDPITGWHGFLMADNVGYCDGSARLTEVGTLQQFSEQEQRDLFLSPDYVGSDAGTFLRRGPTWQMDCYPAPGALIKTYMDQPPYVSLFDPSVIMSRGWPFDLLTENENPYGPGLDPVRPPAPAVPQIEQGKRVRQ
jgi:hypothetical protein